MKKHLIGFCAIAVAVIAFAFTPATKATINCPVNTQFVWYYVIADLNCQAPGDINPLFLDVSGHDATSTNPQLDLAGFTETESTFLARVDACTSATVKLCAVGFNISDVNTTNFESVSDPNDPSTLIWRPKASAVVNVACYVCKP